MVAGTQGGGRSKHRVWRPLALGLLVATALACFIAIWALHELNLVEAELVTLEERMPAERPERPDRMRMQRVTFAALPGWTQDDVAAALPAMQRSCRALSRQPSEREAAPQVLAGTPEATTIADWRRACDGVDGVVPDPQAVRVFLQERFEPWAVANWLKREGLFTGYYEPLLDGSRQRSRRYSIPLYRPPGDIISVDLGEFRDEFEGRRIAGRMSGGRLRPYHDRAAIDRGALAGRGLELLWLDDPVDAFFLHIQGSGRVRMAGGGMTRVGYAGQNGHAYFAIGRELIARGALTPKTVSMQSIRAWLEANPEAGAEVMRQNASYVFFRRLNVGADEGPMGAQGVPLTPGRSLAVDRRYFPMGAPMWLDASAPALDAQAPDEPLQRLMVAQDTGGAIRGPVRGDVYWGSGDEAGERAGRMKNPGRLWVLLPRRPSSSSASPTSEGLR